MFQEDADEVLLWLDSLPTTRRAQGAEAPDGAMLTDEGTSVIDFLDDCVQRCLKGAYRYLEERDALARSASKDNAEDDENELLSGHWSVNCSPLLITVLDQLRAKVANRLSTPSDVLAITSFIRKLIFKLTGKQQNWDFLCAFADQVDSLVRPDLFPQYPSIMTAIRGEISILRFSLCHMRRPPAPSPSSTSAVVLEFLDRVEQVPTRQFLFCF